MRDYWLTRELLQTAGIGFAVLALIGIGLALWMPKRWWGKVLAVVGVGVVIAMPLKKVNDETQQQKVVVSYYQERLAKAQALFDERCKTAGEKIYRTVENVDGVLLMNLRPDKVQSSDQFARYDPYGYESGGNDYIKSFLPGHWRLCTGNDCPMARQAFRFIELKTESDEVLRYSTVSWDTGKPSAEAALPGARLHFKPVMAAHARFGVRWDDVSSDADRRAWIAGGKLSVYDTETMTLIAERVGFLMDPGQGSTAGARSPWSWARHYAKSCPSVDEHNILFVRKVLKPSQGK